MSHPVNLTGELLLEWGMGNGGTYVESPIMATIFTPLPFIASLYGMNSEYFRRYSFMRSFRFVLAEVI
jgi:hypothetical protein